MVGAGAIGGRRAVVVLLFAVLGGAWALPSGAAGAAAAGQPGFGTAFRVKASNGYSIFALAGSRRADGRGSISLFVARKGSSVVYSAPATVTPTTVQADLGELGSISLELEPSGVKKTVRSACGGKPVTYESASYVGTIEFRGEEGFTQASASSTPMLVKPLLDLVCGRIASGELSGAGLPGARLRVSSGNHRHGLSLQLNENRPGARLTYRTSLAEIHNGIQIERSVSGRVAGSSFEFDRRLRTATVRPPAPFSGSAIFRRDAPAARRWTGSLSVDFPGKSNVPLVSRGPRTSLVHARLTSGSTRPGGWSASFARPLRAIRTSRGENRRCLATYAPYGRTSRQGGCSGRSSGQAAARRNRDWSTA